MALAEGEVGEFKGGVEYTAVTTCLTVTCKLAGVGDHYVGGHLSLQAPADKLDSSQVLPEMKKLIKGRETSTLHLAGKLDRWSEKYLEKPLFAWSGNTAVKQYDKLPDLTGGGALASTILFKLLDLNVDDIDDDTKFPKTEFEEREGAFTIRLN